MQASLPGLSQPPAAALSSPILLLLEQLMRASSRASQSRHSCAPSLPVNPCFSWRKSHRLHSMPTGMSWEAGTHRWGGQRFAGVTFLTAQRSPCFSFPSEKYSSTPNPGQEGSWDREKKKSTSKVYGNLFGGNLVTCQSLVIFIHVNL